MAEDEKKAAEMDEAALAEAQRKRGEAIGDQELDDEALDMVSGGGNGVDCWSTVDCDYRFKDGCDGESFHPNCQDMGGSLEPCQSNYGCEFAYFCDEFLQ